jgi:hypothetical protein
LARDRRHLRRHRVGAGLLFHTPRLITGAQPIFGITKAMVLRGWGIYYSLYFAYRLVCSLLGQLVVVRFTSLGDSVRYQGVAEKFTGVSGVTWLLDSTKVTEAIGLLFAKMTAYNPVAINFCFQAIAFFGLYRFLQSLEPRMRIYAAILLASPSFNLWSSVASKEAIVVFAAGIVAAYIVDVHYNRARITPSLLLAGAILLTYKPHYLVAVAFVYGIIFVSRWVRQKEFLLLLGCILPLIALYVMRDTFSDLSFRVIIHFLSDAGFSTRPAFWLDKYDVFWRAPYGMLLSFVGPTIGEAIRNPLQMVSLCESILILLVASVYILANLPRLPAFCFLIGVFAIFWLQFANYPFGVMNPGSAVRYRTGYYLVLVAFVLVLFARDAHMRWRSRIPGERQRRRWIAPGFSIRPAISFTWGTHRLRNTAAIPEASGIRTSESPALP